MNPLDELSSLLHLFPGPQTWISAAEHIPASTTPEPYKQLLVHEHHMTVTMESFYHSPVEVRVLEKNYAPPIYSRRILLVKQGTDQVVQFGIVRFDLSTVTEDVSKAIIDEGEPLGRVLIRYNVLRNIDLGAILKITPGADLAKCFRSQPGAVTYGRLATIFCNNRPAIDLLEIASPDAPADQEESRSP